MKKSVYNKVSARKSDTVSGHTSRPYYSTGKHLLLITCKVTSPEAIFPILRKTTQRRFMHCSFTIRYKIYYYF